MRGLVALLSALICAWFLMLAQTQSAGEPDLAAHAVAQQESLKQACGVAELSCQEAAERDCSLPDACCSAIERPFLVHLSVTHSVVQTELPPPERPPRLRA